MGFVADERNFRSPEEKEVCQDGDAPDTTGNTGRPFNMAGKRVEHGGVDGGSMLLPNGQSLDASENEIEGLQCDNGDVCLSVVRFDGCQLVVDSLRS